MGNVAIIAISSLAGFVFLNLFIRLFLSNSGTSLINIPSIDLFLLVWIPSIITTSTAAYLGRYYPLKQFLIVIFFSQLGYSLLNSLYGSDGVYVDVATCNAWDNILQQHKNDPPSLGCVLNTIWQDFSFHFIPFWLFAFTFFFIRKRSNYKKE